jgi:hypothetical protein
VTSEDIRAEIEREPFYPFRIHLVSGKTFDVRTAGSITMLRNAVLILSGPSGEVDEGSYNLIAMRNIERLERLSRMRENAGRKVRR